MLFFRFSLAAKAQKLASARIRHRQYFSGLGVVFVAFSVSCEKNQLCYNSASAEVSEIRHDKSFS